MNPSIRSKLVLVLVALAALLAACDGSVSLAGVEAGVVPTATLVPTPTLTPTPAPVRQTYTNQAYGFTFDYLDHWTLSEAPHVVTLSQEALTLRIGYRWATESVDITGGRTGVPAGDWIYGDKVSFLGQVIPAQVLQYQRKAKAVFYGGTVPVEAGDLVFVLWLEDLGRTPYEDLDLSQELQDEVKALLESFARIEATETPPRPARPRRRRLRRRPRKRTAQRRSLSTRRGTGTPTTRWGSRSRSPSGWSAPMGPAPGTRRMATTLSGPRRRWSRWRSLRTGTACTLRPSLLSSCLQRRRKPLPKGERAACTRAVER